MDHLDAFNKFMEQSATSPCAETALAFFVGYAYGATGVRENIDALIAAFKETQARDEAK